MYLLFIKESILTIGTLFSRVLLSKQDILNNNITMFIFIQKKNKILPKYAPYKW